MGIYGMIGLLLVGAAMGIAIHSGDLPWLTLACGSILLVGERLKWWAR